MNNTSLKYSNFIQIGKYNGYKKCIFKINSFLIRSTKKHLRPKDQGAVNVDELVENLKDEIIPEWDENQAFVLTKDNWMTLFITSAPSDYDHRLERKWPWNR